MIKIFLASDHAGLELKSEIYKLLLSRSFLPEIQRDVNDLGPKNTDSVDYPDFADMVCNKIHGFSLVGGSTASKSALNEMGILICGSGQGMAMRANKYPHVRAALCWNPEVAKLSREHNDANVLCLGARFLKQEEAFEILKIFLQTDFAGGRHSTRVAKVNSALRQ